MSSVKSTDRITEYLIDFEKRFKAAKKRILKRIAESLLTEIKKRAPKDTGDYAKSWKITKIDGDEAVISTDQGKLYVILEFTGAQPHRIRPRDPDGVLVFEVNGKKVFTKYADHPGQPTQPHVRPAIKKINNLVPQIIMEELERNA